MIPVAELMKSFAVLRTTSQIESERVLRGHYPPPIPIVTDGHDAQPQWALASSVGIPR